MKDDTSSPVDHSNHQERFKHPIGLMKKKQWIHMDKQNPMSSTTKISNETGDRSIHAPNVNSSCNMNTKSANLPQTSSSGVGMNYDPLLNSKSMGTSYDPLLRGDTKIVSPATNQSELSSAGIVPTKDVPTSHTYRISTYNNQEQPSEIHAHNATPFPNQHSFQQNKTQQSNTSNIISASHSSQITYAPHGSTIPTKTSQTPYTPKTPHTPHTPHTPLTPLTQGHTRKTETRQSTSNSHQGIIPNQYSHISSVTPSVGTSHAQNEQSYEYEAPSSSHITISDSMYTRKHVSISSWDNSQNDYSTAPRPSVDYMHDDPHKRYTGEVSQITTNPLTSHVTAVIPDNSDSYSSLPPEKSIQSTFISEDGQKITVVNVKKRKHNSMFTPDRTTFLPQPSSKKRKVSSANKRGKSGKKSEQPYTQVLNQGSGPYSIPMQPFLQGVPMPYYYPTQIPPMFNYALSQPQRPYPPMLQKTPMTPEVPISIGQPTMYAAYGTPNTPTSQSIPTFGPPRGNFMPTTPTPRSPHSTHDIINYNSQSIVDETLHCEVRVSNLTEEGCRENYLLKVFSECGKIYKLNVPTLSLPFHMEKPKYKGIAHITFTTLVGADKAIQRYNNEFLAGSRVAVELFKLPKISPGIPNLLNANRELSTPKDCSELYIVNLPLEHLKDEATVKSMWEFFGPVISCAIPKGPNGQPIGYIFVKYKNAKDASNALSMNNSFHHGRRIQVRYADKKHQNRNHFTGFTSWIFVGGLPPNTTNNEIRNKFSVYGPIEDIEDSQVETKSYAFIKFKSVESVREALKYKRDGVYVLERMNFPEDLSKDSLLHTLQSKNDDLEDIDDDLDDPNIPQYLQKELYGWRNFPANLHQTRTPTANGQENMKRANTWE